MSAPDWIVPGAEIVIYWENRDNLNPTFYVTKVVTVAKLSFKVEEIDNRFSLSTLATKDEGTTWNRARWHAVPPGSPQHLNMADAKAKNRARMTASRAFEAWRQDPLNPELVAAARDAMSELHAALGGAQ